MSEVDIRPVGFFQLWPRQKKKWFCLLLLVWLLALCGAARLEYQHLDPFQHCYLPAYLRATYSPDSTEPQKFSLLMASYRGTWGTALAPSLPGYTGPLIPDQIPSSLLPDVSFRWDSLTTSNAALRPFLRSMFFADRSFVSWTPWSEPCVFYWSSLIALTFPFTIFGAFLIDYLVTRRLRSGIVRAGTRLHTRTTFLRNIVRWKFIWTPWKLGLTFRVVDELYLSDVLLAPLWLLACSLRTLGSIYLRDFADKRILWGAAAFTTVSCLGSAFCLHRLDITLADAIPLHSGFFTLLPLICFPVIFALTTSALFLPGAWSRLANALQPKILGIPADKENQHFLLMGDTGTGKTTTLRVIREELEHHGYLVRGYAPTSRAAHNLSDAGIETTTLQDRLAHEPASTPTHTVHFIDESSLASTKQINDFLNTLPAHDRAVFVGDIRQHESVEAGRVFAQLQESGMHTSLISQIERQKDPELKQIVQLLSEGRAAEAFHNMNAQGRITQIPKLLGKAAPM